ncbi:class I SAM-dependent methyltransferase [Rhodobaculum claviforme]|uniref:SAM-dependent methyltransferase n=1 Tax=Rhodobaculum claviforme TaxID=1549854 RepID=A0A934TJB2_9RHOB|nr:methyltransferase domain-containing protein [Rhodobaculum claviforme]MBK5926247.1 SAM-dependent methyltransferase [Rhodobaculum claviforme]
MELDAVQKSYRRWAPVYDATFGAITGVGRRRAVSYVNARQGSVLEVGVGTGLALPGYAPHLRVTGIDYSDEMLAKARAKVDARGLSQVQELRQMDARVLDFPDASFDTVVAMYLVSVVPEPERVVAEMARVCKPGGEVVIVGHFARDKGLLSVLERAFAPLADLIGWHSDFDRARVMGSPLLEVAEDSTLPPFGMFTFLRMVRKPD